MPYVFHVYMLIYFYFLLCFDIKKGSWPVKIGISSNRDLCRLGMYHYVTSRPGQLSVANPSFVGAMNTSQRVVMPCGWEVKAGMVHVWVAGKTV